MKARNVRHDEIADCVAELSRGTGEDCSQWLVPALLRHQLSGVMLENPGKLAIFHHTTYDRQLFINAAISLDRKIVVRDAMWEAFEQIAKERNCVGIQFCTRRPGLVKFGVDAGYRVDSKLLRKDLIHV